MTSVFISLEGSEGAGKSSLMRVIRKWLKDRGDTVVTCREPGGTATGEAVRELLLAHNGMGILPLPELLLMFASRAQLLEEVIRPALSEGKSVVCDRFVDASFAYQGGGREYREDNIARLEAMVVAETQPDLTLLLDVPVKLGLSRARKTGEPDRFESEQRAFFERVRSAYLKRAKQHPDRIVIVDASARQASVRKQVLSILETRL